METVLAKAKKVLACRIDRDAFPLMYERLCDLSGAIEEVRIVERDAQPDAGDVDSVETIAALIADDATKDRGAFATVMAVHDNIVEAVKRHVPPYIAALNAQPDAGDVAAAATTLAQHPEEAARRGWVRNEPLYLEPDHTDVVFHAVLAGGQGWLIGAANDEPLAAVVARALRRAGYGNDDRTAWEIRDERGAPWAADATCVDYYRAAKGVQPVMYLGRRGVGRHG